MPVRAGRSPEVAGEVQDLVDPRPAGAAEHGRDRPARPDPQGQPVGQGLAAHDVERRGRRRCWSSSDRSLTYPRRVGPVTVRLAVTATASTGTVPRPVSWKPRTTSSRNAPGQAVGDARVEQADRRRSGTTRHRRRPSGSSRSRRTGGGPDVRRGPTYTRPSLPAAAQAQRHVVGPGRALAQVERRRRCGDAVIVGPALT